MSPALTWVLIVVLILLSGLFSGLTLGLLSLDITALDILISGSSPQTASYARAIAPVRKNGNQLLCTLLLGNVAVNALLAIKSVIGAVDGCCTRFRHCFAAGSNPLGSERIPFTRRPAAAK